MPISRLLIIFGLVLVALGLLWPWIAKLAEVCHREYGVPERSANVPR